MKHHLSILFLIPVCFLFVACHRGDNLNKEEVLQSALEYFPYQEGDVLTFYNATTEDTLSMAAINSENEKFLTYDIVQSSDPGWIVHVVAQLTVDSIPLPYNKCYFATTIADSYSTETLFVQWQAVILLSTYEYYEAGLYPRDKPENLYKYLTDTICVPINKRFYGKTFENADKNAYVNFVKNRGLTDFSLDGKTTYRRIK